MPSANEPRSTRFPRLLIRLKGFWRFGRRAVILVPGAASVVAVALSMQAVIFDHSFVIGDFSVPDELRTKGRTDAEIRRNIHDRILAIQEHARVAVAEQHLDSQAFEAADKAPKILDLKFLGMDIPMGGLADRIRGLLNVRSTRIEGALILDKEASPETYQFSVSARGEQTWREQVGAATLEEAVAEIGSRIVERLDPLSAGFYYLRPLKPEKPKFAQAIQIAEMVSQQDKRYVWARVLRGMAFRDQIGMGPERNGSFCDAIESDPSFTPAWRLLANSLRADGAVAEATDLALRLARSRPEEPEGFRELGSLRSECALTAADESDAGRYFDHAVALGRTRRPEASDYITLVDYSRWLYDHYEPGKQYVRSPEADSAIPANADYLDAAAAYLLRAQQLASDQSSVYTNFARVLGYPATDEKKRSRGALYGTGKTKADIALSLDPANPFAKFILGELLTDEGVKEHKYTRPEKFQKAESFLAEAKAAAPYGEAQYEALYARSLAGQGRYKDATALLSSVRSTRKLYYLVEWVQGEALYNQSLLGKDRSLLELALQHLTKARDLRSCGARADAIRDLSTVVAIELSKHPPAAPFVNAGPDASDALIEKRTAAPGKVKLESEIAIPNPDSPTLAPSSRTPEQEPLKPEQGAMQLAPTLAKPSLIPIKLDGEPTRTESALQNLGAVATKPDSSRPSSDAVVSRPARALQASAKIEPKPVCRMWDKLRPDQLSPWVEDNPAKAALLPAFDASH